MSQSFTTTLYTSAAFDPLRVLPAVAELLFGQAPLLASRWAELDRTWACVEAGRANPDSEEEFWPELEFEDRPCVAKEIPQLYVPKLRLEIAPSGRTDPGWHLWQTVCQEIPASVRGEHAPGNASLVVGEHDLWSDLSGPEGEFFARAQLSISFRSYFIPPHAQEFVERFCHLSPVRAMRSQVEALVGPLSICSSGTA